jgi:hypothetical protein
MIVKCEFCLDAVNFNMNTDLKKIILLTFAVFEHFLDPYRKMN